MSEYPERGRAVLRPASSSGSAQLSRRSGTNFNGVKVFSATMFATRDRLGDQVTEWLASHRDLTPTDIVVTQSSDSEFHCVSIIVFYSETGVSATASAAGRPAGSAASPRARPAR